LGSSTKGNEQPQARGVHELELAQIQDQRSGGNLRDCLTMPGVRVRERDDEQVAA
jgi:hypothetical protein